MSVNKHRKYCVIHNYTEDGDGNTTCSDCNFKTDCEHDYSTNDEGVTTCSKCYFKSYCTHEYIKKDGITTCNKCNFKSIRYL